MERLRQSDLDSVRLFLEETAGPCDLASFSEVVLPALQRLIPSVLTCYAQFDPLNARLVVQETYPGGPAKDPGAFERYVWEHPVVGHWFATGTNAPARASDFASRRQWHRTGIYQNVYKSWGCEDSMPAGLPAPLGLVACVCSERDTNFTDRERAIMELVQPHIAQVYRSAEMFTLLTQPESAPASRSMVLDSDGRVRLASLAARRLLLAYCPDPAVDETGLPPRVASWLRAELQHANRPGELASPPAPLTLTSANGDRLLLRLLVGGRTGERALLIMEERPDQSRYSIPGELGLSPREAEILLHARSGLSNAEIAETLCLSRRTVEKHLENIYCKLGVENRGAAVARAFFARSA